MSERTENLIVGFLDRGMKQGPNEHTESVTTTQQQYLLWRRMGMIWWMANIEGLKGKHSCRAEIFDDSFRKTRGVLAVGTLEAFRKVVKRTRALKALSSFFFV